MPIQTCWHLAQKWYSGRLDRNWQRPGQEQIQRLFEHLGLTEPFWNLSASDWTEAIRQRVGIEHTI
jgi:hypothetical protein